MRYCENGCIRVLGEKPLPQLCLGLDVESGGEVVEHQQLGRADQHSSRRRPLDLASGQPDPAGPDQRFEPVGHRLTGERTGTVFRLGDPVRVRVAAVNLDDRKIDFVLADTGQARSGRPRKKKSRKGKARLYGKG